MFYLTTVPPKDFTSVTVKISIRDDLAEFQKELSSLGLAALPADIRPEGFGLGEIIAAGVKSLRKHLPKRRK